MSDSKHVLFAVGKLVRAHGLKGELVLHPMTDSIGRLRKLKRVFIGSTEDNANEANVERVLISEHRVRVKLEHIDDRTGADRLAGTLLFVDEADRVVPPEGRYYLHEVVGLNVVDRRHGRIGTVTEILRLPAQDVYVIRSGDREVLVPAVKEFIECIDVESKTLRVHLIEGMVE